MKYVRKTKALLAIALLLVVLAVLLVAYRLRRQSDSLASRANLLSLMPADASAVGFLELEQLRNSPLLLQLLSWAPQPATDSDYAQFVEATGLHYERDLDRLAIALKRRSQAPTVFAVAEGRFDRKRIEGYASRFGALRTADGRTLFAVPVNGSEGKAYFTFLRDDRVAWANDSSFFFERPPSDSPQEWREHFARVAGTPVFAVLRQDSVSAATLAQAPGGYRSPQLAALLSQLQWISISGKPEGHFLRVVIDGESVSETTVHQLKEVLSGIVVLAQMGLNEPKTRQQLDPQLRQGYLDLLESADIQQLDRSHSKSVRVVFEVTPNLLQAPRGAAPLADPPPTKRKRP